MTRDKDDAMFSEEDIAKLKKEENEDRHFLPRPDDESEHDN